MRATETPLNTSRGFLLSFQLFTLVRKGTSLETNKTFKPTNSGVEDIRASEQTARLSFVDTLACDLRPSPDAATEVARQEKKEVYPHWDDCSSYRLTALYSPLLFCFYKSGNEQMP